MKPNWHFQIKIHCDVPDSFSSLKLTTYILAPLYYCFDKIATLYCSLSEH
jgi:hypothetical protein